jgi:hypothetical protein
MAGILVDGFVSSRSTPPNSNPTGCKHEDMLRSGELLSRAVVCPRSQALAQVLAGTMQLKL